MKFDMNNFVPGVVDPRDCQQMEKHAELLNGSSRGLFTCVKCSLTGKGYGRFEFVTDPDRPLQKIEELFITK